MTGHTDQRWLKQGGRCRRSVSPEALTLPSSITLDGEELLEVLFVMGVAPDAGSAKARNAVRLNPTRALLRQNTKSAARFLHHCRPSATPRPLTGGRGLPRGLGRPARTRQRSVGRTLRKKERGPSWLFQKT